LAVRRRPRSRASRTARSSRAETTDAELSSEQEELRGRLVAALQVHRGNVTDVARALGRTRIGG
jgi:transcriptional regulator of acetoin/glycerol metabolism